MPQNCHDQGCKWNGNVNVSEVCGGTGVPACDQRGLAVPSESRDDERKTANRILASPFEPGRYTASIDVKMKTQRTVQLSIYACDYLGAQGSSLHEPLVQVLTVTDIRSTHNSTAFQQVLPAVRMDHFEGGMWLSVEVHGSVRLRLSLVTGDNPVVAGLFFDLLKPRAEPV